VNSWDREDFDHAAVAHGFALLGKHTEVPCTGCHAPSDNALKFHPASQEDCVSCHRSEFDREHSNTGYPTRCMTCHTVNGWSATFDHAAMAKGFALQGAHQLALCTVCHSPTDNALTVPKPAGQDDCVACHRTEFDREHTGTGFPVTCRTCHDTNDWSRAVFDHSAAANGFGLQGAHAALPCADCHVQPGNALRFPKPANTEDCVSCHRSDYDQEHTGSGYPTTCLTCHTNTNWATATFNHEQVANGFALQGAHNQITCASCHGPNNVLKFPQPSGHTDCIACHRTEFDAEHAGTGFPVTCLSCHTTSTFSGATFDHGTTGFALQGAHVQTACSKCHGANNALLFPQPAGPNDCVACHRADYDREHTGSMYPLTCLTCHTNVTFGGATFDHDAQFFPIYSGEHRGEWATCQDCHPSAVDYKLFNCLSCHKHNQTAMDDKHKNMQGYAYNSVTCLSCHPRGSK
jgi:hypothetical protein